jgi:hypothetical protein
VKSKVTLAIIALLLSNTPVRCQEPDDLSQECAKPPPQPLDVP